MPLEDNRSVNDRDIHIDQSKQSLDALSLNSSDDDGIGFECMTCHGPIKEVKWCKCTLCYDFNICLQCMETNKHFKHKKYLHLFIDYDPSGNVPYCDSCGTLFTQESNGHVFQCESCEDYALCEQCKMEGMHRQHSDDINMITLEA